MIFRGKREECPTIHRQLVEMYSEGCIIIEMVRRLMRAIRNKRPGKLSSGILFIQKNAHPHTAKGALGLPRKFWWDIFDDPLLCPDLAPTDYHLFLQMNVELGNEHLADNEEVTAAVFHYLHKLEANCTIVVPAITIIFDRKGGYVEK